LGGGGGGERKTILFGRLTIEKKPVDAFKLKVTEDTKTKGVENFELKCVGK